MKLNTLVVALLAGTIFASCCTSSKTSIAKNKDIAIQLYSIRDTIARSGNNMESIFKSLSEIQIREAFLF